MLECFFVKVKPMIIQNIFKGSCLVETKQDGENSYSHKITTILPVNSKTDDEFSDNSCYGYFSMDELMKNNRELYIVSKISDSIDSFSSHLNYHFKPLQFFINSNEANLFANTLSTFCQNVLNEKDRIREIIRNQDSNIKTPIHYNANLLLKNCNNRIKLVNNENIDKIFYFDENENSIFLDELQGSSIVDSLCSFQVEQCQIPIYKIDDFMNNFKSLSAKNQFIKKGKDPIFG